MGILEAATQRMKMEEARYEEQIAALKTENERLMKTLADMEAKKISLQDDALPKWINRAEAAERALAERPRGVKVKSLEWDRRSVDGSTEYADSLLGEYQVWAIGGSGYFYRKAFATGQPAGDTIETAKAAAQADYERRIRSALEPAAPERVPALTQVGWAYQDKKWDADRWHVCGWEKPREHEGRRVEPIYIVEPAAPEGRQDDDRIRREMDEILRKQSERDIPFVPSTRPAEQAVTEEWREIKQHVQPRIADGYTAVAISKPGYWFVKGPGPAAALKAAMEAGRHD